MTHHLNSISGGELFERVVADDFTLTERDCILFMRQICEGVGYMHSQSIVHLDLKVSRLFNLVPDGLIDGVILNNAAGEYPVPKSQFSPN